MKNFIIKVSIEMPDDKYDELIKNSSCNSVMDVADSLMEEISDLMINDNEFIDHVGINLIAINNE